MPREREIDVYVCRSTADPSPHREAEGHIEGYFLEYRVSSHVSVVSGRVLRAVSRPPEHRATTLTDTVTDLVRPPCPGRRPGGAHRPKRQGTAACCIDCRCEGKRQRAHTAYIVVLIYVGGQHPLRSTHMIAWKHAPRTSPLVAHIHGGGRRMAVVRGQPREAVRGADGHKAIADGLRPTCRW